MDSQSDTKSTAATEHTLEVSVGDGGDDGNFEFTFHMDGTGLCKDIDYGGEPVSFAWTPSDFDALEGEQFKDAFEDLARELFWEEINDQLGEEQVVQSLDFGSEEVEFETGSNEELEKIVRLILYCFPSLWEDERNDIGVTIDAASECAEAEIDEYCELMEDPKVSDAMGTAIRELTEYALGWNAPVGSHLEYNDGAPGRASGYSETPNTVHYTVPRPSFHELAEAREELLRMFADHEAREEAEALLGVEE